MTAMVEEIPPIWSAARFDDVPRSGVPRRALRRARSVLEQALLHGNLARRQGLEESLREAERETWSATLSGTWPQGKQLVASALAACRPLHAQRTQPELAATVFTLPFRVNSGKERAQCGGRANATSVTARDDARDGVLLHGAVVCGERLLGRWVR